MAEFLLIAGLIVVLLLLFIPPPKKSTRRSVDKQVKKDHNGRDYIYAWQDPDQPAYVKIGRANDWVQRMNAFQTAVTKPIKVVMVIDVVDDVWAEKHIHQMWEHLHVKAGGGSEWFRAKPELMSYLRRLSDPIPEWRRNVSSKSKGKIPRLSPRNHPKRTNRSASRGGRDRGRRNIRRRKW